MDTPAFTLVIVAPDAKLIVVIADPTDDPADFNSTPEITLLKLAPSP